MEKECLQQARSGNDITPDRRQELVRHRALLNEGDIYTILDQANIRKENKGFKYFRLKYWDGHNWIVRFIKIDDTDWIGLSEGRIAGMIYDNVIEKATPAEQLDAIIMEGKNEFGGWKLKLVVDGEAY